MGRDEDTNEPHGHGRGVNPPAAPGQFPACRVLLLGCSCGLAHRGSGRCSAFDAGLFFAAVVCLACSHPGRDPFSAAPDLSVHLAPPPALLLVGLRCASSTLLCCRAAY
jgi:hypothetical protein